jgi:hypothetical protein
MEIFAQLGARIDEAWRARDRDDLALPEIASRALQEHALHEKVSYLDIIQWLNRTPQLPRQYGMDAVFGQPPVTVYTGDGFYIEALYWLHGTTSVHCHAFTGAFQVLAGSSIQGTWAYDRQQRVGHRLSFGKLTNRSVTLLPTGAVQPILPGQQLIHSVFHLDQPSVTVVVRTNLLAYHQPQFTYIRPHIEFDEWDLPDSTVRKLQGLRMLWNLHHPAYASEVEQLLDRLDLHSVLLLLEQDLELTQSFERGVELAERLRRRYPDLIDPILASARVRMRQEYVGAKRALVIDPDHRFFLAVAMNASTRREALELIKLRQPDRDPVQVVLRWAEELARLQVDGKPVFEDLAVDRAVLEAMLESATAADVAGLVRHAGAGRLEPAAAAALAEGLLESPLLRPFLVDEA